MASALTHKQLEVLRRIRDGIELTARPYIQGVLNELGLLRAFGLVEYRSVFDVAITAQGLAYLHGATPLPDAEASDAEVG